MKDLMLDFETLGNGTNKCLCQIGAIYFDSATGELGESFKMNIDAASHERYGAKLDASTVYWWLSQSNEARNSLLDDRKDIHEVMAKFVEFASKATRIWSHATFDFVTLQETLKQLNIKHSISYRAGLDIRTLIYLSGISISDTPREGTHHDALDDCKHQVKYCVKALNKVKKNKNILNFMESIKD